MLKYLKILLTVYDEMVLHRIAQMAQKIHSEVAIRDTYTIN